ncbi:hypothetical protein ONZ45_g3511 [Pleurotus djamor]|nr:hypothetical protein ONZ45_g3511 [Pleurotus djamor]
MEQPLNGQSLTQHSPPLNGGHAIQGDYYAGNQTGGNVGGHNNQNSIINQDDANLETLIKSIGIRLESSSMKDEDLFAALSKLIGAAGKCQELLDLAVKHQATIRNKLGISSPPVIPNLPVAEVRLPSTEVKAKLPIAEVEHLPTEVEACPPVAEVAPGLKPGRHRFLGIF